MRIPYATNYFSSGCGGLLYGKVKATYRLRPWIGRYVFGKCRTSKVKLCALHCESVTIHNLFEGWSSVIPIHGSLPPLSTAMSGIIDSYVRSELIDMSPCCDDERIILNAVDENVIIRCMAT